MTTGSATGFDVGFTLAGAGGHGVAGTAAGTLAAAVLAAAGVIGVEGALAVTLPDVLGTGDGAHGVEGSADASFAVAALAAAGVVGVTGSAAATVDVATGAGLGAHGVAGTGAGEVPVAVLSGLGGVSLGTGSILFTAVLQREMAAPAALEPVDFSLARGATKRLVFDVEDQTGAVVDISLIPQIRFSLSRRPGAPVLVAKAVPDGVFILVLVEGRFAVAIEPEDTEGLVPGVYFYDAVLDDGIGGVSTVAVGRMILSDALLH